MTNLAVKTQTGGGLRVHRSSSNHRWNCSAGGWVIIVYLCVVCSAWNMFILFSWNHNTHIMLNLDIFFWRTNTIWTSLVTYTRLYARTNAKQWIGCICFHYQQVAEHFLLFGNSNIKYKAMCYYSTCCGHWGPKSLFLKKCLRLQRAFEFLESSWGRITSNFDVNTKPWTTKSQPGSFIR